LPILPHITPVEERQTGPRTEVAMCAVGVFDVPRVVRGIIIAPLQACFPFLIIVAPNRILFLRNGMTCAYAPGTRLKVVYTENDDGVKDVVSIQAVQ